MRVIVNGEEMQLEEGTDVRQLIESQNLKPELVVVEHNLKILKREAYPRTVLKEGDRVEIVHFVGGGRG